MLKSIFMTVKRIVSLVMIVVALTTTHSCSKLASIIDKFLNFSTPAQNFDIPPISNTVVSLNSGIVPSLQGSVSYNLDSFAKANTGGSLGVNNVSSLKIDSCVFTISNPTTNSNFSAFDSIAISITTNVNSTPYVLNATVPAVFTSRLTLLPADTTNNLVNYISMTAGTKTILNYQIAGKMRNGTTDTMHCSGVLSFSTRVKG